jgi:ABC-type nitrate/sulfonate/bicarbonate transport system substrate-binding protein
MSDDSVKSAISHNRLQSEKVEMDSIRLGTFTRSVLLDVARSTGRLEAAGLEVAEISVPSSPAQFSALRARELDAVFTSPDNVLAYRFLPSNPLAELLDIEMIAGLDRGLGLSVGARPGTTGAAELAGTRFGVDVANSGFAFVGYDLLARHGVPRESYEVVTLGSTPKRAQALLDGGCDATVLNAGNELRSRRAGCPLLASATELGPYLGTVVARLRDGAASEAVDRLVTVLVEVSDGILDGRLLDAAVSGARTVLGLDDELAAEHAAVLRDPRQGLVAGGSVDAASLATLVDLRRRYLPVTELDGILESLDRVVRDGVLVS